MPLYTETAEETGDRRAMDIPRDPDRYPSLTAVIVMSLLFGPFGFIFADERSKHAAMLGLPRERYWIAFFVAWAFSGIAWFLILLMAGGLLGAIGAVSR